jgi:hypothetical protein
MIGIDAHVLGISLLEFGQNRALRIVMSGLWLRFCWEMPGYVVCLCGAGSLKSLPDYLVVEHQKFQDVISTELREVSILILTNLEMHML